RTEVDIVERAAHFAVEAHAPAERDGGGVIAQQQAGAALPLAAALGVIEPGLGRGRAATNVTDSFGEGLEFAAVDLLARQHAARMTDRVAEQADVDQRG